MTGNPMVGRMPTDSAGDSSTSSSAVLRLQRQSCLGKAIGPFDGDNNNNDGDMLDDQVLKQDEFFRQKTGGSMMTDLADVVTDLTCKTHITDHNSLSGSSTSVPLVSSIKRHGNITKSRESINSRNRKSIPEAQKGPNSRGLVSDHAGGMILIICTKLTQFCNVIFIYFFFLVCFFFSQGALTYSTLKQPFRNSNGM